LKIPKNSELECCAGKRDAKGFPDEGIRGVFEKANLQVLLPKFCNEKRTAIKKAVKIASFI
jgi:hypothetical protein